MKKRRDLTSWTDAREYKKFRGELLSASGRDFEKAALPFLRASWPAVVSGPPLGDFDRKGVDLLAFDSVGGLILVVQCKGFRSEERELGPAQIRQCANSIQRFRDSGLKADRYVLLHNRTGQSEVFRKAVACDIRQLETDGLVDDSDLWSVDDLLCLAFNGVLRALRSALQKITVSYAAPEMPEQQITDVPFSRRILTLDQTRALGEGEEETRVGNVAEELLRHTLQAPTRRERRRERGALPRRQQKTILLGEFGSGKTTVVLGAVRMVSDRMLYVPAARITAATRGAKDFFSQCLDLDRAFESLPDADRPKLDAMARPVVFYLLKDPRTDIVLVLDGLDESEFLAHGGALQALFNFLREVAVPVIVSMRTEFWNLRRAELDAAIGLRGPEPKLQRVPVVEMRPWGATQVAAFLEKAIAACGDQVAVERLRTLHAVIRAGEYEAIYGDLPLRPLFLSLLAEWVAEKGVVRVGRAQLFQHIAGRKIARDVLEPQKWGGTRPSFTAGGASVHLAQELAWRAMLQAACAMTAVIDGRLEMTWSCSVDKVIQHDLRLQQLSYDPLALVLNSLLLSDGPPRPGRPVSVHFAHRAFQEFFLAQAILEGLEVAREGEVPSGVRDWMVALREEGVLTA